VIAFMNLVPWMIRMMLHGSGCRQTHLVYYVAEVR